MAIDWPKEQEQKDVMNRDEFRNQLLSLDIAAHSEENDFRCRMIALIDSKRSCFVRSCFPSHFTGSALVVSADCQRALLHHHRKLDRWLQFGGHCDGDEDVCRVALREAREESGIEGLTVAIGQSELPVDLDIHEIPARGDEPTHLHYDVRYVLKAPENAQYAISEESCSLKWFTFQEMLRMPLDPGMKRLIGKWQKLIC